MFRTHFLCLMLALSCLLGQTGTAAAAETDCSSTYCFCVEDFSQDPSLTGICITDLPVNLGLLQLGSRILTEGDILTAEQVAQMTFSPLDTEFDRTVTVGYLPIYEDHVAESAVMGMLIRDY